MTEQRAATDEPMPPEKPADSNQEQNAGEENAGLNPDGAEVGMGEPNSFEPEEG